MIKEINFFEPIEELGMEESERHYLAVHVADSRQMYRRLPSVQRYTPHRVLRQRDLNRTFLQRPDCWRFVIMHHSGEGNYLRPDVIDRIWIDHGNCLEHIRNYRLEEHVLHDGLTGQTALSKFIVVVPSALGLATDAAFREKLTDAFAAAFGSRLLILNEVLGSLGTTDRGRIITDEFSTKSDTSAILELCFDNEDWGQEFLADPGVAELLGLEVAHGARAYHVREEPGCDHR